MNASASAPGWQLISTAAVAPRERLEFWRDATSRLFPPTRLRRETYDGFYGTVSWLRIGEVTLADIVSTSLEVTRSERDIRRRDEACFEVNIQIEGEGAFRQDDRDVVTGPKSLVLYDSRKPYLMRFTGPYRQISLKLPQAMLRERLPQADRFVARHVAADSVPGRFIYDLACALRDQPENLSDAVALRLQHHLLDLLATALLGADPVPSPVSAHRQTQLARIKSHILAHLDDATLSPTGIAAANGISPRSLHALFAGEEATVARWIQARRLERIRRELADPQLLTLPINTLALRRGFSDLSHFSRAFHRRFGVSPRAYRRHCLH